MMLINSIRTCPGGEPNLPLAFTVDEATKQGISGCIEHTLLVQRLKGVLLSSYVTHYRLSEDRSSILLGF